ncbi:MAG: TolB family protein [Aureliella sp.]
MKQLNCLSFTLLVLWGASVSADDLGVFSLSGDVGNPRNAGKTAFDPKDQTYELYGSGKNMWFAKDEFHFVYRKISGDFILRTNARLVGEGVDPHRKLGWMVRTSLAEDSKYVDVAVHGDGLTSMQFRRLDGSDTEEVGSSVSAPDVIQLSRQGGTFQMSVAKNGETFTSEILEDVNLGAEVYVGLFVCSHNEAVIEQGVFKNVRIICPAPPDFKPYRDYIGSRLETLDVETGTRHLHFSVNDSLQAPNWTHDGESLIFNRNGLLFRYDIATGEVNKIDTGFADQNNNDHVLSFDGQTLGISHHTGKDRDSVIYTLPIEGGIPQRVTELGVDSYLHGWSPDGRYLTYTAYRDKEFDIYRIPASGGKEERLTRSSGLDDGSEYSPDGKEIYFNSSRTGKMQIWRMDPDGSNPVQVTDDQYNNWFPHISPDGRSMIIISFQSSVSADDHPFYQPVYLRLLERTDEGWSEPKVVAYVYGGQGTINVPSWSPDGKQVAFVSNSDLKLLTQSK